MTLCLRAILPAVALVAFGFLSPPSFAADPFRGSGLELNDADWALLGEAAEKLYLADSLEQGATEAWENPKTGNRGTVTFIGAHEYKGMPCRRLRHDIALRRVSDPYRLMVDRCRTPDGEWKIVAP